jgi:hypothetical protein
MTPISTTLPSPYPTALPWQSVLQPLPLPMQLLAQSQPLPMPVQQAYPVYPIAPYTLLPQTVSPMPVSPAFAPPSVILPATAPIQVLATSGQLVPQTGPIPRPYYPSTGPVVTSSVATVVPSNMAPPISPPVNSIDYPSTQPDVRPTVVSKAAPLAFPSNQLAIRPVSPPQAIDDRPLLEQYPQLAQGGISASPSIRTVEPARDASRSQPVPVQNNVPKAYTNSVEEGTTTTLPSSAASNASPQTKQHIVTETVSPEEASLPVSRQVATANYPHKRGPVKTLQSLFDTPDKSKRQTSALPSSVGRSIDLSTLMNDERLSPADRQAILQAVANTPEGTPLQIRLPQPSASKKANNTHPVNRAQYALLQTIKGGINGAGIGLFLGGIAGVLTYVRLGKLPKVLIAPRMPWAWLQGVANRSTQSLNASPAKAQIVQWGRRVLSFMPPSLGLGLGGILGAMVGGSMGLLSPLNSTQPPKGPLG